jgi:RNA polymerase sigma factor (sigma-70 family)
MSDSCCPAAIVTALGDTFDDVVVPHLAAARRLARWLTRNEHDADDVVQEASLRAFRYFRSFTGGNGRAWFLAIVRNTSADWRRRSANQCGDPFDEEQHGNAHAVTADPELLALQADDAALIARALRNLPDRFHQVLALREIEGLSYRELADAIGIPIGTVMSRLARAREALRAELGDQLTRGVTPSPPAAREEEADSVLL